MVNNEQKSTEGFTFVDVEETYRITHTRHPSITRDEFYARLEKLESLGMIQTKRDSENNITHISGTKAGARKTKEHDATGGLYR